ncbi:putative 3-hydroxyisobutyryl-CoA hydrolase [Helianthus annuus]|uniref:3-hydroxyisobutyryl-CoA hydrolase n=1 Tax=Helianthus annuus TaxID=4232 RepID=A0A251TN30_HELAN|nr:putative 3-hydroxyisobutyryl-CoA hydrolase [Helianthus annuus]KAJ0523093.1 putative 3-hydroxyisobutyryl-CoA hydrolase [Helianthus annuus]KAJ0523096.1 putative 3-hydroxyisobutyryl-CoA hydrolase [Helianthus annuus]KAJ0530951.1 putative 3-hydroxyisobutyryl-CoA hydrolase [Helianthus annuus]KAJ0530954.1 putative 3-hydroxyisobutyryl-CoA hydrolase [Helianthus annuus]
MYEKSRAYEDDPTVKLVILKASPLGREINLLYKARYYVQRICIIETHISWSTGKRESILLWGDLASGYTYVQLGHWSFGASYYRKEFCLDYLLATYKKPLLAILDGSVIGGGVGISIHSTFRIVTENTIFAMPEVLIGAFPDVGASYFLSRLPGFFGEYVGLTGARLNGAEMLVFGLGTHFVPSKVFVLVQCYQEYI